MNLLPVEDPQWLEDFKARISLERAIIRKLIHWGFTDSAFEIHRKIEERFSIWVESLANRRVREQFHLPHHDGVQIREILKQHYLRIRGLPQREGSRELLQRGLLTGFEELSHELIQLHEEHFRSRSQTLAGEKAA